jgi:hypothetical protein
MATKCVLQEIGTGNDTKAAMRALQDAIHHSSLTQLRTLDIDSPRPCGSR